MQEKPWSRLAGPISRYAKKVLQTLTPQVQHRIQRVDQMMAATLVTEGALDKCLSGIPPQVTMNLPCQPAPSISATKQPPKNKRNSFPEAMKKHTMGIPVVSSPTPMGGTTTSITRINHPTSWAKSLAMVTPGTTARAPDTPCVNRLSGWQVNGHLGTMGHVLGPLIGLVPSATHQHPLGISPGSCG